MRRLLLMLVLLGGLSVGVAEAQGQIEVTAEEVVNSFPEEVVFRLSAHSEAGITAVTLRYEIMPDGVAAYGQPEFTPGERVQVDFRLKSNDPPLSYLAPGTVIEYYWEIEDGIGSKLTTETATFFYDDLRFSWDSLSQGSVTVRWYSGGDSDAESALQVARTTIDDMSALLGAEIDYPVKVWIYDSYEDMLPALVRRSEAHEQAVVVAGMRVSSDTVLLLSDGGGDILRHELAHIVTHVAGEGPYGSLPAWLDEGTAMYAQSEPDSVFTSALENGIRRDSLFSVRSMTAPTGDPGRVGLFYGQAWSLVQHVVETYGAEKFAELFATFKEGSTPDKALLAVYGFDQEGLEDEWRASQGLSPRQRASPTATVTPEGTQTPSPTPAAATGRDGTDDEGDEWGQGTILGLATSGLALVGMILLGSGLLVRRLRRR
jgi:hypothetical protein